MLTSSSKWQEKIIELILAFSAFIAVLTTSAVLFIITQKTYQFFQVVEPSRFFLDTVWTPLFASKRYGIWALISGSVIITSIALLCAMPFGLLSAIYLSDFAPEHLRKILKPLLEILAGIPTVVYGYFALTLLSPALMQYIPGLQSFNALSPGLVMGLMLIPTISSLCEDALSKTPRELKEAAISLGARKLDTIFFVSLPYARSAILASVFLAFGRAMGETMIVSIAAGLKPNFSADIREPMQTMTAYIVQLSMGDISQASLEYLTIFAVAAMLFILTFSFHVASKLIVKKSVRI